MTNWWPSLSKKGNFLEISKQWELLKLGTYRQLSVRWNCTRRSLRIRGWPESINMEKKHCTSTHSCQQIHTTMHSTVCTVCSFLELITPFAGIFTVDGFDTWVFLNTYTHTHSLTHSRCMTPRLFLLLFLEESLTTRNPSYLILETLAREFFHPITEKEDHQQRETVWSFLFGRRNHHLIYLVGIQ